MKGINNHQNLSMNGMKPAKTCLNGNENQKITKLLEGQVPNLKERLQNADTEKARLLELATSLQKQNELLMLPSPRKKTGFWGYLRLKR